MEDEGLGYKEVDYEEEVEGGDEYVEDEDDEDDEGDEGDDDYVDDDEEEEEGQELWRLDDASQKQWESTGLCDICRSIDLRTLVNYYDHTLEFTLGYLDEIMSKSDCAFCRLVARALQENAEVESLPAFWEGERIDVDIRFEGAILPQDAFYIRAPLLMQLNKKCSEDKIVERIANVPRPDIPWIHQFDRDGDESHSTGRIIQPWLEYDLLKSWMSGCECPRGAHGRSMPDGFRLIDLHRNCIVSNVSAEYMYVALSYTWGRLQRPFLTTHMLNLDIVKKEGALTPDNELLPRTIRDAMTATKGLGFKYLWVDSLCIIQDDEIDKSHQIGAMDEIYANAVFTIAAVAGEDADAGLPGIYPTGRVSGQHLEVVQGMTLGIRQPTVADCLDYSSWNTRAWTLQERVLSQRIMVFSASHACFRTTCCMKFFTEDRKWQLLPSETFESTAVVGSYNAHNASWMPFDAYARAVEEVNDRELSLDNDAWNAFVGVANQLKPPLRCSFIFGLPDVFFDHGLLWKSNGPRRRRFCPVTGGPLFPSWSWLACSGPMEYMKTDGSRMGQLYTRMLIRDQSTLDKTFFSAQEFQPTKSWKGWRYWRMPLAEEHIGRWHPHWQDIRDPDPQHMFPILDKGDRPCVQYCDHESGRLELWTHSTSFSISHEQPASQVFEDVMFRRGNAILNEEGTVVGQSYLDVAISSLNLQVPQSLILLSRTRFDNGSILMSGESLFDSDANSSNSDLPWDVRQFEYDAKTIETLYRTRTLYGEANVLWDWYNVMLVDRIEDSSTRLGIGYMNMAAFHAASPKRTYITLV